MTTTNKGKALLMATALGLATALGCAEESSVKSKTEVKGPGGTSSVTKETKVETKGDNPPAVPPAPEVPK